MLMLDAYLVAQNTRVSGSGDGEALDISAARARIFLLTLHITAIIEQQALDVSVWGSADGTAWGEKSLAAFPQKFYLGKHPLLLDLTAKPDIRLLRAHWQTNRWGRGTGVPMFEFDLTIKEVPAEILRETAPAVSSRG